jgi:hypothetical protein
MRRESDENFVCPLCMETVFRGHCGCPDEEEHGQDLEAQRVRRLCSEALLTLRIFPRSLANQDLWRK